MASSSPTPYTSLMPRMFIKLPLPLGDPDKASFPHFVLYRTSKISDKRKGRSLVEDPGPKVPQRRRASVSARVSPKPPEASCVALRAYLRPVPVPRLHGRSPLRFSPDPPSLYTPHPRAPTSRRVWKPIRPGPTGEGRLPGPGSPRTAARTYSPSARSPPAAPCPPG